MTDTPGRLILVGTPIGNLQDLSPRALAALRAAAAIYCEDTRVTAKLASRFGIGTPRISCHEHNERRRIAEILSRLSSGQDVALVSDAGMPALSDPGEAIVAAAAQAGFRVEGIPGPSAAVLALSLSGLPAVPHTFLGFAPARRGPRRAFFRRYAPREETLVLFESPHRVGAALEDAADVFGARQAVLARELTKAHEEVLRATLPELGREMSTRGAVRGEIVLVVAGASPPVRAEAEDVEANIERLARQGKSKREIAREISRAHGVSAREVYRRLLDRPRPESG